MTQNNENDERDETDENDEMGDTMSNSSDFNSGKDSDDENGEKYPVFSEQDSYDPKFVVGLCFSNKKRIQAVKGCQWRIHALKVGNESSYQIREYHSKHNCGGVYHVKNCNSAWIGKKFEDLFRTDPNRNVDGFRQDVIKTINIHVSQNQAYRAKWAALKNIEVNEIDQYGLLWDYAKELRSSKPGSTVIMSMSGAGVFGKFYVCFKGLKDRFLVGCRTFIGVDGCHLQEPNGGEGDKRRNKKVLKQIGETKRVYAPCIYPVNGPDEWKETGQVPPIPPNLGRGVGRPPRARSYCGESSHNKKGCQKRKDAEAAESEEANDHVADEGSSEPVAEAVNEYEPSTEHNCGLGDDWGVDWDEIFTQVSNMEVIGVFESQPSVHLLSEIATETQQESTKFTARKRTISNNTQDVYYSLNKAKESAIEDIVTSVTEIENQTFKGRVLARKNTRSRTLQELKQFAEKGKCKGVNWRASRSKIIFKHPSSTKQSVAQSRSSTPSNATRGTSPTTSYVFGPVRTPKFGPSTNQTPSSSRVATAAPRPPNLPSTKQAKGVKITESVFSEDHPRVCVSLTTRKREPLPPPYKVIEKEGKRFGTMKNLTTVLDIRKGENLEKNKGKKKM
ncbi:hypothetical protein BUALT_Bualt06G0030400 [Buddleja alternifolia]|uniref:Transposase MuDR plant domain-containing protein n=1 Tax=Buddleja alternifolia TaxID=168488 RepID=A0AAV6XJ84_9LAMI|nr:hypothetical protein BUALT_Bualt06G0030400 [Buddleja alternifolia]